MVLRPAGRAYAPATWAALIDMEAVEASGLSVGRLHVFGYHPDVLKGASKAHKTTVAAPPVPRGQCIAAQVAVLLPIKKGAAMPAIKTLQATPAIGAAIALHSPGLLQAPRLVHGLRPRAPGRPPR